MKIFNQHQQDIAEKIEPQAEIKQWKDWKWQVRHSIRTIEEFENLTGIHFDAIEKEELEKTINRFPLSITPYYLSQIGRAHV